MLTKRDLEHAHHAMKRALRDLDPHKNRVEHGVSNFVKILEVQSAALAFGFLKGRFGAVKLGPVPVDLLAGAGMHLFGFTRLAGNASDHIHNFADGVLASYATTFGAGLGTAFRVSSGLTPFASSSSSSSTTPPAKSSGFAGHRTSRPGGQDRDHASGFRRTRFSGVLPPGQASMTAQEIAAMAHAVV